jgi:hypothetical protein
MRYSHEYLSLSRGPAAYYIEVSMLLPSFNHPASDRGANHSGTASYGNVAPYCKHGTNSVIVSNTFC